MSDSTTTLATAYDGYANWTPFLVVLGLLLIGATIWQAVEMWQDR